MVGLRKLYHSSRFDHIFPITSQNAIAVSLVAICGTTFSSTLGYVRHRQVDYKLGLFYDILDLLGIALGA